MTTESKTISLKEICRDHKLCPRVSRMLLRECVKDQNRYPHLARYHKPRTAWIWPVDSKSLNEALSVLKVSTP